MSDEEERLRYALRETVADLEVERYRVKLLERSERNAWERVAALEAEVRSLKAKIGALRGAYP